jgi:predicted RNA-binding Zn ribbon-like protein
MATAETDLLLDFLHTREEPRDPLATPAGLAAWMAERELAAPGAEVTDDDLALVRHVRAALRSLFAAHSDGMVDDRTRATLERVTAEAPLLVTVAADSTIALRPGGTGVRAGLARLVALLYRAAIDGTLPRYKTCKKCGFAFYDESKNRSRVWCDMALCGSRAKASAYRARKKHG